MQESVLAAQKELKEEREAHQNSGSTAAAARAAVDKTHKSINDHLSSVLSKVKKIAELDAENGALKLELDGMSLHARTN